jgi:DinB superfamily
MKSKRPVRKRKAPKSGDAILRQHLIDLLRGGHAHVAFEKAVAGLPAPLRGARHPGLPFTAWSLLEHLRIAQWDILEFSRDPQHVSPKWPEGYWPAAGEPAGDAAWDASVQAFERDLSQMEKLVKNPATDLFRRIPHGTGQTILREALLLADHNAYHLGQLVMLRRLLGAWEA